MLEVIATNINQLTHIHTIMYYVCLATVCTHTHTHTQTHTQTHIYNVYIWMYTMFLVIINVMNKMHMYNAYIKKVK